MKKNALFLTVIAVSLAAAPAWSAKKKSVEEIVGESKKAADAMVQEMAQKKEQERLDMENYWDSQPEAGAVLPGRLFAKLKKTPWPDARPVPKEKYFERPEVKARVLDEEEGDPLLAGLGKKEKEVKNELEAAQKESDEARFNLWLENLAFYQLGIDDSKAGNITGSERVKLLESAQVFIKEGEPRFYLIATADRGANKLKEMGTRIKELIPELEKAGQYVPDYRAMAWAEKMDGQLAAGDLGDPAGEKEKQRYYKIVDRIARFDPRLGAAKEQGAEIPAVAGGGPKDEKWEEFLTGLIARNNKALSGINFAAQPSEYPALIAGIEKDINALLASFPAGWQKYPRARWAHDWFSGALEKSGKAADPKTKGQELFKALNDFESGLR